MRCGAILELLFLVTLAIFAAKPAHATVVTFDDLDGGMVPATYAGISWGFPALTDGKWTSFTVSRYSDTVAAHSAPTSLLNGSGVADLWFEFAAPVHFNGAWLAAPRATAQAARRVRFVDDAGHASQWLELTDQPQRLVADFPGSKIVHLQSSSIVNGVETAGGVYAMDDLEFEAERIISAAVRGTGKGAVNSDPAGYVACSGLPDTAGCTSTTLDTPSVSLIATPSFDSQFTGWDGACSACSGPYCTVSLDSAKSCIATIDIRAIAKVGSTVYGSVAGASADIAEGSPTTMKIRRGDVQEDLDLSRDVRLTVLGGCDADFAACSGTTTLHGSFRIGAGSISVQQLKLAAPRTVGATSDALAPSPPSRVTVTSVRADAIGLSWQPSRDDVGVAGYEVLRNGSVVATVRAPSHLDAGLSAGAEYSYAVRAFDAAGNLSRASSSVAIITLPGSSASVGLPSSAAAGDTVTLTVDPAGGQVLGPVDIFPLYSIDQKRWTPTAWRMDAVPICTGGCTTRTSISYTIPAYWTPGSYFFCVTSPSVSCSRVEITNPQIDAGSCSAVSLQGSPDRKLDIVFVADNFDVSNIELFSKRVEDYRKVLLSVEPFASNAHKINFWKVERVGRLALEEYSTVGKYYWYGVASRCEAADLIAVLEGPAFSSEFRPHADGFNTPPSLVMKEPYGPDAFVHEMGHAIAFLGDEYGAPDIQDTTAPFLRANRDVAFCPKWCSGVPNTAATLSNGFSCWTAWQTFNACVDKLQTGERATAALDACWTEASDMHDGWFAGIDRCDFGTGCRPGTGCFWNSRGSNLFRSTDVSIMSGAPATLGFNPPSVEAIKARLDQYW